MAELNFQGFEAVIRNVINPAFKAQFEQSRTLYNQFGGSQNLNSNPPDNNSNPHPWTDPDGLQVYTQLMRGERELPHRPGDCGTCRLVIESQISLLGLDDRWFSRGTNSANPVRRKRARRRKVDPRQAIQRMLAKSVKLAEIGQRAA